MDNNATWGYDTNGNPIPPPGGHTPVNFDDNKYDVFLNSYYNDITDLGEAATVIHEALHCQYLDWYRQACIEQNLEAQQELTRDYGYLFDTGTFNVTNQFCPIVNNGNTGQHQDMANRYRDVVAESLYQFAQAKVITTTLSYCQDLAWSGLTKSRAFEDLSQYVQDRIKDRVNAEKDPNATHGDSNGNYVNANNISAKGHHPCI